MGADEISYKNVANLIVYRTVEGTEDISGDYTSYESSEVVTMIQIDTVHNALYPLFDTQSPKVVIK